MVEEDTTQFRDVSDLGDGEAWSLEEEGADDIACDAMLKRLWEIRGLAKIETGILKGLLCIGEELWERRSRELLHLHNIDVSIQQWNQITLEGCITHIFCERRLLVVPLTEALLLR